MNDTLTAVDLGAELEQAVAHQQSGRYGQAEAAYRRILAALPDNADANHLLGMAIAQSNRLDSAQPYFRAAIEAAPAEPRFWTGYIDALTNAGWTETARQVVKEAQQRGVDPVALDLQPAQIADASAEELAALVAEFMSTLAVLLDRRRFEDAESVAGQLTALLPDFALGWQALATAFTQQGKHAAAVEPLRRAAKLLPDDEGVQSDLADALAATEADTAAKAHRAPVAAPAAPAIAPLTYADAAATHANSKFYQHLAGGLVANIPVLIPTFNNATYLRNMIPQLAAAGLRNLVIVDNASSAPEMLSYLDALQDEHVVVKLDHNAGPHSIFLSEANYARLPDIFCITDPDLEFNRALPREFLFELIEATEHFRVGKAGFALDIANPHTMQDDRFRYGDRDYSIWEWESRFWQQQIGATLRGDPIYNAPLDTTFAVYNKRYFNRERHICGVRFAGSYTCRHLPWYKESGLSAEEEAYYRAHQKWSTYLKHRV